MTNVVSITKATGNVIPIIPPVFLDKRSEANLKGVHPDLIRVVRRCAALGGKFIVIEGTRTLARQRQLVSQKKSQTLKSRHLGGFAVDCCAIGKDGQVTWDEQNYLILNKVMQQAAHAELVPVEWGGEWHFLKDLVHFQLPASTYPDSK